MISIDNNNLSGVSPSNLKYDQYQYYPSNIKNGWYDLFLNRFENNSGNNETSTQKVTASDAEIIISISDFSWDFDHFGFRIAKIHNPIIINKTSSSLSSAILKNTIEICKTKGIKTVIARVNGDNLEFIHALENVGFKYYETIIWPVSDLDKLDLSENNVSFINPEVDSIDPLLDIAKTNQYQRGHFHCDNNFDKTAVNSLYAKWVKSAISSGKKIAVIKDENTVVGYFICEVDKQLSSFLGVKYGRLQSLALDTSMRGRGFGKKLFEGTLSLLKKEGCKYVDSGFATKNHMSAKLHTEYNFFNVYEEVTMHFWI